MSKTKPQTNKYNNPSSKQRLNYTSVSNLRLPLEDSYDNYYTDTNPRNFRRSQKRAFNNSPKDKAVADSLTDLTLMDVFQFLQPFNDIHSFKEQLSDFLRKCYSKYLTHYQDNTIEKIYYLIELLHDKNPTISFDDLSFLISLGNNEYVQSFNDIIKSLKDSLRTCYSKYLTYDPDKKIKKIYNLIDLLQDENPTISIDDLFFLISLDNEKGAKIKDDLEK